MAVAANEEEFQLFHRQRTNLNSREDFVEHDKVALATAILLNTRGKELYIYIYIFISCQCNDCVQSDSIRTIKLEREFNFHVKARLQQAIFAAIFPLLMHAIEWIDLQLY